MKKTAVEWFESMLNNWDVLAPELKKAIIEQAIEMEKDQITNAVYFGHLKGWVDNGIENSFGEEYYNRTFKSE